jgi:hypothetical protein
VVTDHSALLKLFRDRRENNHRNLIKAIISVGLDPGYFESFLEDRRTNDDGASPQTLLDVKDYDRFLKVLEDVVQTDKDDLLRSLTSASDICAFVDAIVGQCEEELNAISRTVSEYYCERISKGKIGLPGPFERL